MIFVGRMPEEQPAHVALCLNVGSSSLKFAVFHVTRRTEQLLADGSIDQLGRADARVRLRVGAQLSEHVCSGSTLPESLGTVFALLEEHGLPRASVVGHRVVHGGRGHSAPARIDGTLLESLKQLVPLAPLHLPSAIAGIEATAERLPGVPQVACFDTAFHAGMPEHAARFALPARLFGEGVRRYGFHGLSYEYVLSTLGEPPPARVIIAHLGNGASLAAIHQGRSIDTTMGLTPGGGILMGTRSGDLDPGVLLYLLREKGYSVEGLERLLECESGLLGIAGSADMRALSERFEHDESARLAVTMFGYAVRKAIGAYSAALGGVDVLVFTGGIGEHAPLVRAEACRGLAAFGIVLDDASNARNERVIHAPSSACQVLVLETDEDRMIARHAGAVARALS
ncbi:MAG: acetate/propionate family kinase [Pseudomonadota bacterium]